MTPEGKVLQKIVVYAKKQGFEVHRNHMGRGTTTGRPDLTIFLPFGRVIVIEVKKKGEAPRKLQEHRLQTLRDLGHNAIACDSFESARDAIDAMNVAP